MNTTYCEDPPSDDSAVIRASSREERLESPGVSDDDPQDVPVRFRLEADAPAPVRRSLVRRTLTCPVRCIRGVWRGYVRLYLSCPGCGSEEVYAISWRGRYVSAWYQRSILIQPLACERCTLRFARPALLFGAPPAALRPPNLYD